MGTSRSQSGDACVESSNEQDAVLFTSSVIKVAPSSTLWKRLVYSSGRLGRSRADMPGVSPAARTRFAVQRPLTLAYWTKYPRIVQSTCRPTRRRLYRTGIDEAEFHLGREQRCGVALRPRDSLCSARISKSPACIGSEVLAAQGLGSRRPSRGGLIAALASPLRHGRVPGTCIQGLC
jgi:hypothetical protein